MPTPTPSYSDDDVDAVARMLYGEQRSESPEIIAAAAWTVRNRVTSAYGGGLWPTYKAQVENGQYQGIITPEERDALTGENRRLFEDLRGVAESIISGAAENPMAEHGVPDAIFFANTYSDVQSAEYERLLNNPEGPVGPGNWDKMAGIYSRWFYFYRNKPGVYPTSIPVP